MEKSLNHNQNCNIYVNSDGSQELSDEEKNKHLDSYYEGIVKNFTTESILGNDRGMSLADIYIEPKYQILQSQTTEKGESHGDRFTSISDDSIHSFLDAYVAKGNLPNKLKTKDANIILLLGQPGQGKTSFSKKLMYDYCSNRSDSKYFMIRLRDIANVEKLLDEPLETIGVKLQRMLGFLPNLEEETVLLLDGLDELAMKEQLVTETIDSFLETLTESTNRAKIYKQMFDSIINRKWEDGKEHENLKGLEPNDIRELLQTIAFEIYKSDYEYIHRSKLEKLPAIKEFYKSIDIEIDDKERLDGILKGVLISFYFQEVQKDGDDEVEDNGNYAIEFMHKSLQEYLVAEKMFDEMLRLIDKDRKKKYFITDYKDVLKIAWKLFSSHQISSEIQTYLIDIIKNYENKEEKLELADRLASFLPDLFEKDFLYEFNLSDDFNPMKKSLNVFYGYWTVLSSLGGEKNYILEDFKDKFSKYIRNLFNESMTYLGNIAYQINFSIHLNISYQVLSNVWLSSVFFQREKYIDVNLSKTHLVGSWFGNIDFYQSDLTSSNFSSVSFFNVSFIDCNLSRSEFINTVFHNCTFQNTKLNNIYIDDENAEYLRKLGVEFTRYEEEKS